MGTTLTGTTPQDTYDSLIKVTDNGPLSATLKALSDGLGNDSVLSLSTAAAEISAASGAIGLILSNQSGGTKVDVSITENTGATIDFNEGATARSLNLASAGTSRLFISNTGNVGIGTSSPATKLEIFGTGNTLRLDSAANGAKEILFRNVGTQTATIRTDGDLKFETEDSAKFISFFTNSGSGSTERVRIQAAGGISFNGDTLAANALDDYEEGTWTPRVFDDATGGNEATYTQNEGVYTKIGNMVYWRISISLASKGSMTAGNTLYVRNFPFTSATIPSNWFNPTTALTWGATFADYLVFHQQGGTTFGYLYEVTSGGNGGALLVSDYTATAVIIASGFYRV